MHPVKELRKLLEKQNPNSGRVVSVGSSLLVTTNRGQINVTPSPGDATRYVSGDEVILMNGIIIGRRKSNSTTYVL